MTHPRPRVLVTGGSGGLGGYVVSALVDRGYEVLAPSHVELDVTDARGVREWIASWPIVGAIHLAALANVDRCETHPEEAVRLNVFGTRNIVELTTGRWPLVFMGTNDVFSECSDGPFDESRTPAPGMAYAWSKFSGEQMVLAAGGCSVRANFFTRWCNAKESFVAYVLKNARAGQPFRCYTNVVATPVFAGTLAGKLVDALANGTTGVLHVCSSDWVDRAEQARLLCQAYGLSAKHIDPVPLLDRRGRPLDARLASVRGGTCGTVAAEIEKLRRAEPPEPLLPPPPTTGEKA